MIFFFINRFVDDLEILNALFFKWKKSNNKPAHYAYLKLWKTKDDRKVKNSYERMKQKEISFQLQLIIVIVPKTNS